MSRRSRTGAKIDAWVRLGMRIISLSTISHCGIASYNNDLQAALGKLGCTCEVEPITRDMREDRSGAAFSSFIERTEKFDAVVLQHEFSFYGRSVARSMRNFARIVRSIKKPVAVFLHTPTFEDVRRGGRIGDSWAYLIFRRALCAAHVTIFVHGRHAAKKLKHARIRTDRLHAIAFPASPAPPSAAIRSGGKGVVTLGTFGFVAEYKGYECLLKTMPHLPDNFRLIIAGGHHREAPNDPTLNKIFGFLHTGQWQGGTLEPERISEDRLLVLRERVAVAGYIPSARLNAIFDEIDLVVAPYTERGPAGSSALAAALSRGKPTIATATPAFREVNEDWDCLRLVAMRAPYELASAIADLAANVAEQSRLSAAARRYANENTFDVLAEQVLDVLFPRRSRSTARQPTQAGLTFLDSALGQRSPTSSLTRSVAVEARR
jgi:glycosyltransferase involved in cell wall biosynthesis